MTKIVNNQKGQPLNKQEAKSNDKADSEVPINLNSLTINVFFDGTGNNLYNTKARLNTEHTDLKGQVSYDNYYSNVALLQLACTEDPKVKKVYIMGSGTFEHEEDSTLGLGFTWGESGVYRRVSKAFSEINNLVKSYKPNRIIVNAFGFSRGAFYARYFCAMAKLTDQEIKDDAELIKMVGYENYKSFPSIASGRAYLQLSNNKITINFVGIYDTVSSEGLSHYNDVKPFNLNIGKKQGIAKIVHLTAQNEYRNHFPLTRVNTAASQGVAFECSFPGAHSDLGGSYNINHKESIEGSKLYISIFDTKESYLNRKEGEVHWSWFVKKGYYKPATPLTETEGINGDFEVIKKSHFKLFGTYYQVYSTRVFNANSYQFIGLNIMKKMSTQFASLDFSDGSGAAIVEQDIGSIAKEAGVLSKFADYAYDYVDRNCTNSGLNFKVTAANILSKEEEQEMYHKYIHNSLNPSTIPNGGDKRNKGPFNPERIIINDNV